MNISWSTINVQYLRRLPVFGRTDLRADRHMGSGCFMDPPGYPTYFLQSIYNSMGNEPRVGALQVITDPDGLQRVVKETDDWERACRKAQVNGTKAWDEEQAIFSARLRRLWQKLPLEHERTQAWITVAKGYFHHCYEDPTLSDSERRNAGKLAVRKELSLEEAQRWAAALGLPWDEDDTNTSLLQVMGKTDRATTYIQEWYPEYQYEPARPGGYGKGGPGHWWERFDYQPTPEECPGDLGRKHPFNNSWCQMCGWQAPEAVVEVTA